MNIERPPASTTAETLSFEEKALIVRRLAVLAVQASEVKRKIKLPDGTFEDDAQHSFSLALVASIYAEQFLSELDAGRIAQYSLIHDLVEIYADDTMTLGASEQVMRDKALRERVALERLIQENEDIPVLVKLLVEYEEQIIPETRFVRMADKWLPDALHIINGGVTLAENGISQTSDMDRTKDTELARYYRDYGHDQQEALGVKLALIEMVRAEVFGADAKIPKDR